MTVIQDRDVTVPHVARSGEYEAACICYKCQGLVHLALPSPIAERSLLPVTTSFWGASNIVSQPPTKRNGCVATRKKKKKTLLIPSCFCKLIHFPEYMFVFLFAHTNRTDDDRIKLVR